MNHFHCMYQPINNARTDGASVEYGRCYWRSCWRCSLPTNSVGASWRGRCNWQEAATDPGGTIAYGPQFGLLLDARHSLASLASHLQFVCRPQYQLRTVSAMDCVLSMRTVSATKESRWGSVRAITHNVCCCSRPEMRRNVFKCEIRAHTMLQHSGTQRLAKNRK